MTKKQLTYFKNKLLEEKHRILQELDYERDEFKDLKRKEVGDLADAAFQLSEKNRQIEKHNGHKPHFKLHIEGVEALVKYKGPVGDVLDQLCAGIRSGFSY